jgi:ABC-2 type transport system permease protein
MQITKKNLLIMLTFLRRDVTIVLPRLPRLIVQYSIMYALLYGICFGYLVPRISLGHNAQAATLVFIGIINFALLGLGFAANADFLVDFERDRFIDYQLIILPPRWIIMGKFIFGSCLITLCFLPFYPAIKFMFGDAFDLSRAYFPAVVLMLLAASCMSAAYHLFFFCLIKQFKNLRHMWRRINYPMTMLGGFLIPWHVMMKFSPYLGYLVLLNPLIYVSEGLRSAFLDDDCFIPYQHCLVMLMVYTVVSIGLTWFFFKRKVDHI